MPYNYQIAVFCNECGVPHPTGIALQADELIYPDQSVGDVYDGRELPASMIQMQNNVFTCPTTGKQFTQSDNKQVFLVRTPSTFRGQTFTGATVVLDNSDFEDCTFRNCELLYRATPGPIRMVGCGLHDCSWRFEGAALATLQFLSAIYSMGGDAHKFIEATFDQVRKGGGG